MQAWDYRKLRVWARSRDLAVLIHRITGEASFRQDRSLRDQMRRAAVSVPSNIAEGNQREGDRDCARFLNIAQGSLAELSTQIEIALAIGSIGPGDGEECLRECDEIRRILAALIRRRLSSEV